MKTTETRRRTTEAAKKQRNQRRDRRRQRRGTSANCGAATSPRQPRRTHAQGHRHPAGFNEIHRKNWQNAKHGGSKNERRSEAGIATVTSASSVSCSDILQPTPSSSGSRASVTARGRRSTGSGAGIDREWIGMQRGGTRRGMRRRNQINDTRAPRGPRVQIFVSIFLLGSPEIRPSHFSEFSANIPTC